MVYQKGSHYYHGASFISFSFSVEKKHDLLNNARGHKLNYLQLLNFLLFILSKMQAHLTFGLFSPICNNFPILYLTVFTI